MNNYDNWKLSNPVDDGCGYDLVSNCCGSLYHEEQFICFGCGEPCEEIDLNEYNNIQKENYLEAKADAEREER
tara:strand:+ start:287 stop:505 length:219 start_codon:yes stop_codon:yes gene_type:complete